MRTTSCHRKVPTAPGPFSKLGRWSHKVFWLVAAVVVPAVRRWMKLMK